MKKLWTFFPAAIVPCLILSVEWVRAADIGFDGAMSRKIRRFFNKKNCSCDHVPDRRWHDKNVAPWQFCGGSLAPFERSSLSRRHVSAAGLISHLVTKHSKHNPIFRNSTVAKQPVEYNHVPFYLRCVGLVSIWIGSGTLFYSWYNQWPLPQ